MLCRKCGMKLSPKMKFCPKCGEQVGPSQKGEARKHFCENCGAELQEGIRFCLHCGAAVERGDGRTQPSGISAPKKPTPAPKKPISALKKPKPAPKKPGKAGKKENNRAGKTWKDWLLPLGIIALILLLVIGTIVWYFMSFKQEDWMKDVTNLALTGETLEETADEPDTSEEEDSDAEREPEAPQVTATQPETKAQEEVRQPQPEEDEEKTESPTAEEPEASEDYTYFLYRKTSAGSYETGGAGLDCRDCDESKYLWPSDTVRLTDSDLDRLTKDQITFIKNEIYARHGYVFSKNMDMKEYFESRSWYRADEDFTEMILDNDSSQLSSIEMDNINTIAKYLA